MGKMIGIILCLVILFSVADVSYAGNYLGGTKYGWAEKEVYGNQNAQKTIVLITGVHPREYQFHNAIVSTVKSKSKNLSKRYVVYKVHVTKSPMDFKKGRMYGQLIANKFVVPDVIKNRPKLVVDIHEDGWKLYGYKYCKFLDPISKDSKTQRYIKDIRHDMPFLKVYSPSGTSPKYITIPISKKGIPTVIYETYMLDSYSNKLSDANKFISALDKLKF